MMPLRFHEIAESRHRILNPITDDQLRLVGEICALDEGSLVLDLCCGKAEMLCTWSARWGIRWLGVDISQVFLDAAHLRARELDVENRVSLLHGDAAAYVQRTAEVFDVACCLGATWIGQGLEGTLGLLRSRVALGELVVVGEPYWIDPLPEDASIPGIKSTDFESLVGTLDRINAAGFDLIEMVLANGDSWDRYAASQWNTVDMWLRSNPTDPDAEDLRAWDRARQRRYLAFERRHLGWGVFILRRADGARPPTAPSAP
jgi:hypothetical protein